MAMDLKSLLRDVLSQQELDLLVRSYDMVGDIAIIIIPEELTHYETVIAETILESNKRLKVVAKRDGNYQGEFRTIDLKIIGGENRLETIHKEFGVRFLVNPQKVYFSVRSGTERKRISTLVQPEEEVLVLFSGIAPYPLVIAANSNPSRVVGIEKNPLAHHYGLKNLALNKRCKNIQLIEGDAASCLPQLGKNFDRIIMPLPRGGEQFLPLVLTHLKPGGWLHYYEMQQLDQLSNSLEKVHNYCNTSGRTVLNSDVVKCGHCAPKIHRVCVDSQIG